MHKTLFISIVALTFILTTAAASMASWQVNLEVSAPDPASDTGTASNKLSIGTDPTATDGYDNKLDTPALLKGTVQASISHPEYASNQQKLWRDFRKDSLPQEWQIEVASSGTNNPIKISWKIDAPGNLSFTLIDKDSNQEISMASSTEYSYSSTTTAPKKFLLKASENLSITPSTGSQSSGGASSAGGSKGGGCGYIIDIGGKNKDGYGQIMLNMIILIIPLLLPLQNLVRNLILPGQRTKKQCNPHYGTLQSY